MSEVHIREYVIEGRIGNGGMGSVFLARHNHLGTKLALKVLHQHLTSDETVRARFLNEAKLMSGLHHPNIVELKEYFENKDSLILVMEYVAGRNLDEMIGSEVGPIPWERALPLFLQVLEGIGYAHTQSVVHRDIKPANILVSEQGRIKITDFGIAKIAGKKGLTKTGTKLGTIYYMSPEQIRGSKDVDLRADIYSLGITLYEMLAGCLPFGSDEETTEYEIMKTIVSSNIPDPRQYYPHIPEWLVMAVRKAISPSPDDRFADCSAMFSFLSSESGGIKFKAGYWSEQVSHHGIHKIDEIGIIYDLGPSVSEAAGRCPGCDTLLIDGTMFCSSCGINLAMNCPGCNSMISKISKFCPSCGIDVQKKITEMEEERERQCKEAKVQQARREEVEKARILREEKLLREKKAREEKLRIKRDERRRRRKIWWSRNWQRIVLPTVLIAVIAGIVWYLGSDSYAYSKAEGLYKSGDLERAASAFAALSGYEDSYGRQLAIEYEIAEQFLVSGDREQAISAFSELGNYSDSEERIMAVEYAIAEDLLESGDRSTAATAFQRLGSYADSDERADSIRYVIAEDVLETGDYNSAIILFQRLGSYSDSEVRVRAINYDIAVDLLQSGELDRAAYQFRSLGSYLDSQDRADAIEWLQLGFEVNEEGIITDVRSGNQWLVSPNQDSNWEDGREWVNQLGGNWRMPTLSELENLHCAGITNDDWGPFDDTDLRASDDYVWSGEEYGPTSASYYSYSSGSRGHHGREYYCRVFAVR